MFREIESVATDLWLLPDGVEEILPPESGRVEDLRRQLLDLYHHWGYQLVFPPLVEFLESLLTGAGQDLDLQTFKITDQATGKLMGVRADMTPQMARIDARNVRQGANRFCYVGTVLRTRTSSYFPSRAPVQTGCELFGVADAAADIEVISMMIETLKRSGVKEIHMDLSHLRICQQLLAAAGLSPQAEGLLRSALLRKSIPDIKQLAEEIESAAVRKLLLLLPSLSGGPEVLNRTRSEFSHEPEVIDAIELLDRVVGVVSNRYPDVRIFIDLCDLRGFNYHTGIVFAAYTPGIGHAIAQGGRYDGVGSDFGHARPATGFSADLKALLRAGDYQPQLPAKAILAPVSEEPSLWQLVAQLRQSDRVIQCMPGEETMDWRDRCDRQIVKAADGSWQVEPITGPETLSP